MKLYTAKIQLGGNADNQVVRDNLSAAELKVLEFIHAGKSPGVIEVKHTANVERSDTKERARIAQNYSKSTQDGHLSGPALVEKLFGVAGVPLPQEYEAPVFKPIEALITEDDPDEVITPVEAAPIVRSSKRTRLEDLTN